jgi:prevent-host-death family protein
MSSALTTTMLPPVQDNGGEVGSGHGCRVERGEGITITRHGRPAAVLLRPDSVRMRRARHTIEDAREVAALVSAGRDRPLPAPAVSAEHARQRAEAIRLDRDS